MPHRTIWVSDIHLNFVDPQTLCDFVKLLVQGETDSILISGDIGDATTVMKFLEYLERNLSVPVYFVLGNHDFYHGEIACVREAVSSLCARSSRLNYLSTCGPIRLTEKAALIGHDGWADGRFGNYDFSKVVLNDYLLIKDFFPGGQAPDENHLMPKPERLKVMQSLAEEAASHFARYLSAALDEFEHIVVVTHVPPFAEACWHEGKISSAEFLPHFSCKAVGEGLLRAMEERPDRQMTVLCGHTHGTGDVYIRPNLRVLSAGAEYHEPGIQAILGID